MNRETGEVVSCRAVLDYYGDQLCRIPYGYDQKRRERFKTIEHIVEESDLKDANLVRRWKWGNA